jgi:UDP-glucuronate 4-epimerase
MKVIITGAAGFIGSHLCERLLALDSHVVGLDSFDSFYDPAIKRRNLETALRSPRFRLVEGDIRDPAAVDRIARAAADLQRALPGGGRRRRKGPLLDAVIHLAARAGVRPSVEDPVLYSDVNLVGTTRMLEAARSLEIPRFIFASSSSVYGDREGAPFREDDNVDFPISPYAATKKAGEVLCHAHHHLHGFAVTCLRFFTVYGPRQRPEMAIHKFTRAVLRGEALTLFGDGSARRDFTYIDDIVDGTIRALERADGYHIYNLGNSRTVEVSRLISLIEKACGTSARIDREPGKPGDVRLTCADITRAGSDLGYNPCVPIEEGIERFVEWYRRNLVTP